MKKLLLSTAVAGLAFAASPAMAEGVTVEAGGFFKGYVNFVDQDEATGNDVRDLDILRHTEVYLTGETTLDNGLTVGVYVESEADNADAFEVEESYVYFSGDWGRVNFGAEDGAAYLLQVAAPAADENVDGIRQFVNPINFTAAGVTATGVDARLSGDEGGLDYDNDLSQEDVNKITYLSPVFSGFQVGISYTPDLEGTNDDDFGGNELDNQDDVYGEVIDLAARWEGDFDGVGVTLGAGYATATEENDTDNTDDRTQWNIGANVNTAGFTVGAVYTEDDYGDSAAAGIADEETYVLGASYETGAFKLGASYLETENVNAQEDVDATRYAGGVTYTYGPGLSFRGSLGFVDIENGGGAGVDVDGTYLMLGTQVNF